MGSTILLGGGNSGVLEAHIFVPALRGFSLPKMNLAEVGQSTMRGYRKMWLREAAFADIGCFGSPECRIQKVSR